MIGIFRQPSRVFSLNNHTAVFDAADRKRRDANTTPAGKGWSAMRANVSVMLVRELRAIIVVGMQTIAVCGPSTHSASTAGEGIRTDRTRVAARISAKRMRPPRLSAARRQHVHEPSK